MHRNTFRRFYSLLRMGTHSLNLNQWTATDSQWLFTDGSSYKFFTKNQWKTDFHFHWFRFREHKTFCNVCWSYLYINLLHRNPNGHLHDFITAYIRWWISKIQLIYQHIVISCILVADSELESIQCNLGTLHK